MLYLWVALAPGVAWSANYSVTCLSQDYVIAEGPPPSASLGISTIRIGANNNNPGPGGRNAVMIFALPALPFGQQVISAALTIDVAGRSGSPSFNGDLWGIGFQTNTTPLLEYFEADSGDSSNTKLQDNVLLPSTSAGSVFTGNSTSFGAYLQTFYATNPAYGGGAYVFLRLNPDANAGTNSIGWSISAGETTNAAVLSLTTSGTNPPVNSTNFIVIITDDHRWDSMGVVQRELSGAGRFPWFTNGTPNLDRLAAAGVRFRNAFVVLSLCSPSRAAILSGRYNHLNGIINNSTAFPASAVTFASRLQQAGYVTGMIGKWHMGNQSARPGFSYWASFLGQGNYNDTTFQVNGVATQTTGWIDDVSTDYALNFITANQTNRFALMLGYKSSHAPHTPPPWATNLYSTASAQPVPNLTVAPPYRTNIANTGDATVRNYHRCLTAMDAGVGRILDHLDQLGLTTNTCIVFIGDNGFYLGEHGLGDKRSLYEASLRVPLLLRYPRLLTQPVVRDEIALNIDIAPTLLDLAGLAPSPDMQGRSWRPLLGPVAVTNWRKSFLAEYFLESGFAIPTTTGVRTENAKLVFWPGNPEWCELFNLTTDGYEVTNLFNVPSGQTLRQQLRSEYDSLIAETGLGGIFTKVTRTNSNVTLNLAGGIGPRYELEGSSDSQSWSSRGQLKMTNSQMTTGFSSTNVTEMLRLRWTSD